jgi:exonuclease III
MASVIQWNIRGLRANYNELLILMQSFQPVAFCLQELQISNFYQFPNRQYSLVSKLPDIDSSNTPTGGSGILIRKDEPRSEIKLDSPLQALACRISIPEPISVLFIYLRRVLGTATTFCLLFPNCLHLSYSWETSTRTARCGVAAPPTRKGLKWRNF